jgi:hypothetical protein
VRSLLKYHAILVLRIRGPFTNPRWYPLAIVFALGATNERRE